MRIAVIGAGGVGGYFGAKLARAGNDVAFVARGAQLAALRARGLRVESAGGDITLAPVVATDDPSTLAPVDAVMLCVKLWDVEAAARQIRPLVAAGGVVIPFQNGIDAHEIVAGVVGPDHVLGGVAYISAAIAEPGVIRHVGSMARLRVGAFAGGPAAAARTFVDAAAASGIEIELAADIRRALWEKFVFLTALSGVTSLARSPVGVIRSDPDLRAAFEAAVREGLAAGKSEGVALGDAFTAGALQVLDSLPAEMRTSMQVDLEAGHRLEAPWLCGRVASLARRYGFAAPVNATIYAALKPFVGAPTHSGGA